MKNCMLNEFLYLERPKRKACMVAYREESMIAPDSMTETFVAGKLEVDNCDMAGVPIYIRTGKRLATKATRIDIVFKKMMSLYLAVKVWRTIF